jgi:hypothetical protein
MVYLFCRSWSGQVKLATTTYPATRRPKRTGATSLAQGLAGGWRGLNMSLQPDDVTTNPATCRQKVASERVHQPCGPDRHTCGHFGRRAGDTA